MTAHFPVWHRNFNKMSLTHNYMTAHFLVWHRNFNKKFLTHNYMTAHFLGLAQELQ